MKQKDILATIEKQKSVLANEFGVRSLALFGSFARQSAKGQSDVDILVEFDRSVGLFEFARLKIYLEKKLGREVDLVTPEALRPEMREAILREAVHVA